MRGKQLTCGQLTGAQVRKRPGFLPPERAGEEDRGVTQMGYKLLAGDLAGEVFTVEPEQTVRALDHAEAVGNETVLQLIAGH